MSKRMILFFKVRLQHWQCIYLVCIYEQLQGHRHRAFGYGSEAPFDTCGRTDGIPHRVAIEDLRQRSIQWFI